MTVRPETEEPLRLPDAAWPLVEPALWAVTFDAVTSPPKSENEFTELEAVERAFAPTSVDGTAPGCALNRNACTENSLSVQTAAGFHPAARARAAKEASVYL